MDGILNLISSRLGDTEVANLSRTIGADQAQTQQALGAALPVLLGALARNAGRPDGAQSLHSALERDHDGSALDDVIGTFGTRQAEGAGILRHMLGDRRGAVERAVQSASGLGGDSVGKLLPAIAPLLMGALGRSRREGGLDPTALAGLLAGERQQVEGNLPRGLASLLDADGDGDITDDLAKVGKGLLGRLFK